MEDVRQMKNMSGEMVSGQKETGYFSLTTHMKSQITKNMEIWVEDFVLDARY